MKIDVETISKEMIKPSTPTPSQLRHYQFSHLDQIGPPVYISLLYFYHLDDHKLVSNNHLFSNSLKSSLSNVLTKYYPLAGRIKNNYVDCNDEGVVFSEAKVSCHLSEIVNEPKFLSEFKKLLPFDHEKDVVSVDGLAIAIQVNIFNCGNVAIAVMISHRIADGSSLITFTKNWAAVARGESENILPEFVAAKLFPPKDAGGSSGTSFDPRPNKVVLKKFLFEGSKITTLRDKYGLDNLIYPTRVEALSAFLWSRLAASTRIKVSPERPCMLVHAVNLRKRMEPQLPADSFGNLFAFAVTILEENHDNRMVNKFRDAIGKIDKDYLKAKNVEHSELIDLAITNGERFDKVELGYCIISSLCKFPVYEADFGLGKPIWVAWGCFPYKNVIHFMDTKSGDGIEVWVHLEEEVMAIFENDQELLAYVST
ncbi:hypothetical protein CUMW_168950 [Citrus unshiu]|uniref:Uncharacterized protein n=1 Tax=Citrus unshiu TaxID=55188 RepID=A0A2H5PUP1_CITUN|nr:hypothetical protein CUMW_168950 [Citrus unshiu]